MNRTCRTCGEEKPLDAFTLQRKHGREYRAYKCKACRSLYDADLRESRRKRRLIAEQCDRNGRISRLINWRAA